MESNRIHNATSQEHHYNGRQKASSRNAAPPPVPATHPCASFFARFLREGWGSGSAGALLAHKRDRTTSCAAPSPRPRWLRTTTAALVFFTAVASARAHAMAHSAPGAHTASGQGYLGIDIRTVTDPAVHDFHLRENRGVVVIMVDHDGPAWKAGIREHDVVQNVNGTSVDSEEQLRRMLREMQPGRTVQIGISRDGSTQSLNATMANRDDIGRRAWEQHYVLPAPSDSDSDTSYAATAAPPPPPSKASRYFGGHSLMPNHILPVFPSYTGAVVDEIGPQLSDYFGLKGGKGLLVQSVESNSPAAAAGLHAGDVVLRVNGQVMESHSDWNRALHDSKGHTVSVVVMRDHREQTLTMVPNSKRRGAVIAPAPNGNNGEPHWLAVMLFR